MAERPGRAERNRWLKQVLYYKYFYVMLLPAIVYFFVFHYFPMYGSTVAFREFSYRNPFGGEWVGLKYFDRMMADPAFIKVFMNTLIISFGRNMFEFPVPILLALLLNEVRRQFAKRFFQTVFTFPHFISWVVAAGIVVNLLSDAGVINQIVVAFGGEKLDIMTDPGWFRALLFISDNWKEAGWGTIIYLATIASISPEIYEAAKVDGARRFQLMRHITWPAMRSVMGILLILQVANVMNAGFDQIFNMYNPVVYDSSDIIDTYIYRRTFIVGESFSSSTALGLFKSVINVILLFTANYVVKKINKQGIY